MVSTQTEKQLAGKIMAFALASGIAFGATSSFIKVLII